MKLKTSDYEKAFAQVARRVNMLSIVKTPAVIEALDPGVTWLAAQR